MKRSAFPPSKIALKRILFRGFKSLEDVLVGLRDRNVLTGPNNSGKSTIVASLRLLDAGLRRGLARRPEPVVVDGKRQPGYVVSVRDLPISLENCRTDYKEGECRITYTFSSGNSIALHVDETETVTMTCVVDGSTGGFDGWQGAHRAVEILRSSVSNELRFGIVLDRDYRPSEAIDEVRLVLVSTFAVAHILQRKEIENYLISAGAISRAVNKKAKRAGRTELSTTTVEQVIETALSQVMESVRSQVVGARIQYDRKAGIDAATSTEKALREFEKAWRTVEGKLLLSPGKEVLGLVNRILQAEIGCSVSAKGVAGELLENEIPNDLADGGCPPAREI